MSYKKPKYLDSDELLVKAEYFIQISPTVENLRKIKKILAEILIQDDFVHTDFDYNIGGIEHHSMRFICRMGLFNHQSPNYGWPLEIN